ncbi:hypothetical protein B0H14DRAFT_3426901 [Mycena olivaceomarginata]|nr:hypothetical protein B0H14DRAFT_3426901 [Mycena olivaceomarginata]
MSRPAPLSLSALLNPEDPVDASGDVRALLDALGPLDRPFLVAPNVHRQLQEILRSCTAPPPVAQRRNPPPATVAVARSLAPQADPDRTVEYNVRVSDKTILPDFTPIRAVPASNTWKAVLGMKACPLADLAHLRSSYQHTSATRADVEERLAAEREARLLYSSPSRDIFQTTAAYITAVRTAGCRRPQQEPRRAQSKSFSNLTKIKLLATSSVEDTPRDSGPLDAQLDPSYLPTYSAHRSPNHWVDFSIRDAGYNIDYIAAVFTDDREEAERIELEAKALDIGPLAKCKTVVKLLRSEKLLSLLSITAWKAGSSSQEMAHLQCDVKFRIWWPVDRTKCRYALVTSRGTPRHPVPLPLKTPNAVRSQILSLLQSVRQDLPDMTARRFLRHPRRQISSVQCHPALRSCKTSSSLRTEHYIRLILELNNDSLVVHEEDEPALPGDKNTRIIICMSTDSSKRLQDTQYLQSDIGFKRIVGFDEFEIAAMDRDANTSVVFCRAYVTRHTAAAHQRIFDELNKIVMLDTGTPLRWRHLHGQSPEDFQGLILQWGADQHRGQAKGRLGLHLVDRAAELPIEQMDMHEPWRSLHSLGPYDHLRRLYRVCKVHNYRNIRICAVTEPVRQLMRSLACIRHPDWDGTIAQILASGGKAGTDWVRDKESCKFAFPGICWEKSFIPLAVWNAGESNTNLIETVHSDVNREGQYEAHGIRPSYAAVTPVTNAVKNVKHRGTQQGKKVAAHALAVGQHNAGMQKAHDTLRSWNQYVYALECLPLTPGVISPSSTPEYHRQLSVARVTARQAQNNCIYSLSYWDFDIDDFILAPKKKPRLPPRAKEYRKSGPTSGTHLLLVRRPSTFSSEVTPIQCEAIPIQISESLANALARSIQIRHDLIYGGIAARPPAVAVWGSYFAASTDLLQMTWFGPAHAEDAATLTQRVRTLCTLACALDALEAQGHPTASQCYQ